MTLQTQPKRFTRQGVIDLNAGGYNGKRPTCPHYGAPGMVSVERRKEPHAVGGEIKDVNAYYCMNCGVLRWIEE